MRNLIDAETTKISVGETEPKIRNETESEIKILPEPKPNIGIVT